SLCIDQGLFPGDLTEQIGIPEPDQAGEPVGHGAIIVVQKARLRSVNSRADLSVVASAGAGYQLAMVVPATFLASVQHARRMRSLIEMQLRRRRYHIQQLSSKLASRTGIPLSPVRGTPVPITINRV